MYLNMLEVFIKFNLQILKELRLIWIFINFTININFTFSFSLMKRWPLKLLMINLILFIFLITWSILIILILIIYSNFILLIHVIFWLTILFLFYVFQVFIHIQSKNSLDLSDYLKFTKDIFLIIWYEIVYYLNIDEQVLNSFQIFASIYQFLDDFLHFFCVQIKELGFKLL